MVYCTIVCATQTSIVYLGSYRTVKPIYAIYLLQESFGL